MAYDNKLQEFLQSKGITQSDLSFGTRISNVTINKICRQKLSPSKTLMGKINQYLVKVKNCTEDEVKDILPAYVAKVKEEVAEIKTKAMDKTAKVKAEASEMVENAKEEIKEQTAKASKKVKEITENVSEKV